MLNNYIQKRCMEELDKSLACETYETSSASSTHMSGDLTKQKLDDMIEKLKPKYAIVLNGNIEYDKTFVVKNVMPDKYYCEYVIFMNSLYYEMTFKKYLYKNDIKMKVYY